MKRLSEKWFHAKITEGFFQKHIDQAVSKSLYIDEQLRSDMPDIYLYAWKQELKSTYYCFIDKTIKGEKYTSQVNKRGLRRGFGKARDQTTQDQRENGEDLLVETVSDKAEIEREARTKYGDEMVDKVMSGVTESCPTDPLLAKICPSCE
jgi:ribonucleoside-diphosphate reductase alpha chain